MEEASNDRHARGSEGRRAPAARTRDWLKYWIDIRLTERPWLLLIGLLLAMLGVVAALVVADVATEEVSDSQNRMWEFLGRAFGADNVGAEGLEAPHRLGLLAVTIISVVIIGAVAGSITTWLTSRMDRLRRGRSRVVEAGHTLLVGWSPATPRIIRELAEANASEGGRPIVILADRDKVEMEEELRERVNKGSRRGSRVVTRRGLGSRRADLDMVSAATARAILLMPDQTGTDEFQIATAATICNHPDVAPRLRDGSLAFVAPVRRAGSIATLRAAMGDVGLWVPQGQTVSKIIALAARQSGLACAYEQLFSFDGSEIYYWPTHDRRRSGARKGGRGERRHGRAGAVADIRGLPFRVVQHGFVRGTPIGLRQADGRVVLNPRGDRPITDGDRLIVLAEDNDADSIRFDRDLATGHAAAPTTPIQDPHVAPVMHILVAGLGPTTAPALRELDGHVAKGSRFTLLTTTPETGSPAPPADLTNARLEIHRVEEFTTDTFGTAIAADTDAVLVFPERTEEGDHAADMRTVSTLLQLRSCLKEAHRRVRIVTEILDETNIDLVDVARPDDAVVSDRLVSLYCLQLAEQPDLREVYEELLDSRGCELSFHPVEWYLPLGVETDFHVAIDCVSNARATFIGYRRAEHQLDRTRQFGIELNPDKSRPFVPMAGDMVIVIAPH